MAGKKKKKSSQSININPEELPLIDCNAIFSFILLFYNELPQEVVLAMFPNTYKYIFCYTHTMDTIENIKVWMIQKQKDCLCEVSQIHNLVVLIPKSFWVSKILIMLWLFSKSFLNTWHSSFSGLLTHALPPPKAVDLSVYSFSF